MNNVEAFIYKQGGQGNSDTKNNWITSQKDSNELTFIFEAKQYGYVAIEGDGITKKVNDDQMLEIKINKIDINTGKVDKQNKDNGPRKCLTNKNNDQPWVVGNLGCIIDKLIPQQKYQIVFNTIQSGQIGIKNIRIF